ncbi:NeuD/PglB/VioB family sugar acetyltransferase [Nocardioides sp. 503]|uniref:NeuD/PglB/VioB family sugar acetyltransferase n=1 Tax=Nocardioides sp. 503 TaxID=2508326 RepID=UPI00106F3796|nr:NeuD/PglB/VioB family sugar acetyltransferase [Nocardioides sp. 503]
MRLVLVAASGLALEAIAAVRTFGYLEDAVVLDDDPGRWGTDLGDVPVVGGLAEVRQHEGHRVLVCAGRGTARRSIVERLAGLGVHEDRYLTLVHPSVSLPADCTIGRGSILLAGVVLTAHVRLGSHVVVMPNATLTHDDDVADYATVCAGAVLGGRVRVGRAAYVGMNASVREGLTVGPGSTLGMGAALTRDLPPEQVWAGVPARRLEMTLGTNRPTTPDQSGARGARGRHVP